MDRIKKIDVAIFEAERFIARAKACKKKLKRDNYSHQGCAESGAMKRSSMDLSRALVDLRR